MNPLFLSRKTPLHLPGIVHYDKNDYYPPNNQKIRTLDRYQPMKPFFIQPVFLFFFLYQLVMPHVLHAGTALPRQDINITFDLDKATMQGNSVITLPPDMGLQLYLGDLENVAAEVIQGSGQTPLAINADKTITLATAPEQRTISLSWQLTTTDRGFSDNLISPEGITLAGLWHPAANHDMLFSLTAALPRGFNGITEAEELVIRGKGNTKMLKAGYPHPLQSINFAAGPYTVRSRRVGSTTLYTYFFPEDAGLAAGYLDKAAQYIKRYEKLIGPFPFTRYSIVENRLPTGYGMPTFTLLGQAVIRLPFIKDTSLGHEILHSWFGNTLRLDDTGNWCEGLTTYLADQSYAADRGKDIQYRKNQLMRYQSYVHADNITTLIDFRHGGDSQPMAKKMRAIGYDKASMVFHMLRREVGDEQFFTALRQLYAEYKYRRIGWTDIETVFSETTGRDLSLFFGQWLLRHDIPNLSTDSVTLEQENGRSVVSFHLMQQNKAPYRLQVPVIVKTLTGETRKTVKLDSLDQQVSVTVDNLPTELLLDPEYDLMRSLQPAERYPAWMQLLGAEKKTVVLPAKEDMERYMPLMADLERSGCQPVTALELKNSKLGDGSFVFLGNSSHTLGLFGRPDHPAKGFTLDVRKNPLNPDQVMVLAFSSSPEETARAMHKLSHYGKYSYLHFTNGRIQEKRMAPSANGIALQLLTPPAGIPVQQAKEFNVIVDDLLQSRVVYVGEKHTDYSSHLLQLQIIQALYEKNPNLVIGMEMFPRSSQQALDDYIGGKITDERQFLKASDYFSVWGYDYRLYRDIIGYAKTHHIPLVGLNLDKQIVSTVFRKGTTDELTKEQLAQVAAERDLELPGYRKRLHTIHAMHKSSPHGSNFGGFLQAQSMWDETMAESIVNYLQAHPEKRMVVIAGTGHVYKDSAIPPRVARRMNVRQSVLIAENNLDRGMEEGKQVDYLMFASTIDLPPAGKIGVVLHETKETEDKPGQVRISQISPHGKAGQAGLKENDTILAIDDLPVTSVGDLKAALMDKHPGDVITLKISRQDTTLDIKVELTDMDRQTMMMPPGHPKK